MGQRCRHDKPLLRVISGDLDTVVSLGNIRLQLAPSIRPPFSVAAQVVEQDTALILDEEPLLQPPGAPLGQIEQEMSRYHEPAPGSIVVPRGQPGRLYAVVHNLELKPTWREEWVLSALENLLRLAQRQQLRAIALPPIGCRFGSLSEERFLDLLFSAAVNLPPVEPLKLWLVVPRQDIHRLLRYINSHYQADGGH